MIDVVLPPPPPFAPLNVDLVCCYLSYSTFRTFGFFYACNPASSNALKALKEEVLTVVMSCTYSVLRVLGPDLELLDELRGALQRHFQINRVPSSLDDSSSATNLVLTNRYFTAVIGMHNLLEDAPGTTADVSKDDGVILVVASSGPLEGQQSSPFDTLTSIHDAAEGCGKAGDLLRLCVAVTTPSSSREPSALPAPTADEEYSRRILWCLDRGYEYVEVDLSDEGIRRGHDERDKDGFARVVEALHATVWSSAVMHPKKQRELLESYDQIKRQSSSTATPLDSSIGESGKDDNAYEPPNTSLLGLAAVVTPDEQREEAARQALLLGEQAAAEDGTPPCQENMDSSLAEEEEHRRERYFDGFESALREAGRIRERSRAGELSDDDRRQRAGDAALLLMDLMGKMEGFDESESEPEDDDVEAPAQAAR